MKRLFFSLATLIIPLMMSAQGWPSQYGGVMLQGFYWDSYTASQWTKLESQADELSQYFSLIWIPQSGKTSSYPGNSMGYNPLYYFDQNSSFGTEDELRSMIKTFKLKGLGTIADVVVNHRANISNWVDFPAETYKGTTYQMQSTDICANDDGGAAKTWASQNGYSLSSNNDDGEDFGGYRDLDHQSANVQKCVKAYIDYLLNDLGYTGLRYDVAKGFAASHFGDYNKTANVQYSVGEYFDYTASNVTTWIYNTSVNDVKQSGAFDFPFRNLTRTAANNSQWSNLLGTCVCTNSVYKRYAVTFVENHDTEYRSSSSQQDPVKKDTLAVNAWMMGSPGTPCVFLKHWRDYKKDIKIMIEARKFAGIHNESAYKNLTSYSTNSYAARQTTGTNCDMIVAVGSGISSYGTPTGYKLLYGGYHYKFFVPESVSTTEWQKTIERIEQETKGEETFTPYDVTVYVSTDLPSNYTKGYVNYHIWDSNDKNLTVKGAWPGDKVSQTQEIGGKTWYYQTYSITGADYSINAVFSSNSGSPQTVDVSNITSTKFYEVSSQVDGSNKNIVNDVTSQYSTAIKAVNADDATTNANHWYTLNGMRISTPTAKGVYIHNGKKVVVK